MIWREAIVLVVLLWTSIFASAQAPTGYDTAPGELRPILLTGTVVLGSGEAPTERIAIQQRCGPRTVSEVYTDSKGRFSFQIGGNSSLAAIDTRSSRLGAEAPSDEAPAPPTSGSVFGGDGARDDSIREVNLTGCTVVADAPGYRADPIPLGRHSNIGSSDIGVLFLTSLEGAQASIISVTSLKVPKKARSAYAKALDELQKGPSADVNKAVAELEKATEIHPEYAVAWTTLGQARLQAGDAGGAKTALERALGADPRYVRSYRPLAFITVGEEDWARTIKLADVVLSATPGDAQMRWFRALSQFELRNLDEAEAALTELHNVDGAGEQFPQSYLVLGMIHAQRGDFKPAASQFRRFLELSPNAAEAERLRQQLADWERQGAI